MRLATRSVFGAAALAVGVSGAVAAVVAPTDVAVSEDYTVEMPLTDAAGDAEKGRSIFANRKLGNCLACHENGDLDAELFHGEVGPSLNGVGNRFSEAELRAILVNSKAVFGDQTIMPSFYSVAHGARTMEKFEGVTILEAQQVEDVIAYLKTLDKDEM